jgi:hypothetical protein
MAKQCSQTTFGQKRTRKTWNKDIIVKNIGISILDVI